MESVQIDADVKAAVWERAKPAPFEHLTFNAALRRVLGLGEAPAVASSVSSSRGGSTSPSLEGDLMAELAVPLPKENRSRPRAPKADLETLVRLGLIKQGEDLTLVDYRGVKHSKYRATVHGGDLAFKGKRYSMSSLAGELLQNEGYVAESVRGPDHWITNSGKRIRELWEGTLKRRAEK